MQELKVPQNLVQAVLDYLITKPFKEVNVLITNLAQCKPVEEKPVMKEKPKAKPPKKS